MAKFLLTDNSVALGKQRHSFCLLFSFIWETGIQKEKERRVEERKREMRKGELPSVASFFKCSQWPGLERDRAGSWEWNPELPCRWKESNYLSHHHHLPRFSLSSKFWLSNPGTPLWNAGILIDFWGAWPRTHSNRIIVYIDFSVLRNC